MPGRPSRRLTSLLLALAAALLCAPAAHATRADRAAARDAFVYGMPLLQERATIARFPRNTLTSIGGLATAASRLVVLPNNDTTYTVSHLDLRAEPVVLHVPALPDRYYCMQFLDAYTNTFAYVGRRATGTGAGDYAIAGPGWTGTVPAGVRLIRSPTPDVWLLGRTLVSGPEDVPALRDVLRRYGMTTLGAFAQGGPLSAGLLLDSQPALAAPVLPGGVAFLDLLGTALAENPPPRADRPLLRRLAAAGIGPGRTPSTQVTDPARLADLAAGVVDGRRAVAAAVARRRAADRRSGDGWSTLADNVGGPYGTDYLSRAVVAEEGLGANQPREAVYLQADTDAAGRPLSGARAYRVHFAARRLPPVGAFWSLTMYDADRFLVDNPLNRFSIGDRTPGVRRNRDGSLDLWLSATAPSGARAANWLPAPAGRFSVTLRLYQPRRSVLRGTWAPPAVTRVR